MEKLNLKLPVEGYRVKLKPSDEQLQEAFVSVSYTHLDVYKRQA